LDIAGFDIEKRSAISPAVRSAAENLAARSGSKSGEDVVGHVTI